MNRNIRRGPWFAASAIVLWTVQVLAAAPSYAQGVESEPLPEVKAPAQKAPKPSVPKSLDAQGAPQQGGGDQALRQRVEQLEEQLVDLQVVIGTLESLARSGVRAPPASVGSAGPMSGSEEARLDSMETQIRALTAQIEQLSSDVRAGAGRRSEAAGTGSYADNGSGGGDASTSTSKFGSTTVTSDQADPIGGLVAADQAYAQGNQPQTPSEAPAYSRGAAGGQPAATPPPTSTQTAALGPAGASAKQLYESAYGYLLQQDYASAQAGFSDFLKTYPKDPLAPNALYWLGETHYVQRNYADAAEAFDLVISAYGSSNKAPDAQLKRGMSLAQLGKKQDACTAFRELSTKFPSAPPLLKSKADGERQRAGCT
jgi:tol-pal system protein YbgF